MQISSYVARSVGDLSDNRVLNNLSVRPVINLSSDVEITKGVGTASDPFVVKVD